MKTFVIADIGLSHNGSLSRAKCLIDVAKECGCSAVKFQTYITDNRVSKDNPTYNILKKCELSFEQQKSLKEYADLVGIEFVSTPYDFESLNFLVEDLGVRRIQVVPDDITNTNCLLNINEFGNKYYDFKVILSVPGATNSYELSQAIECFENVPYLTLMHCVPANPIDEKNVNLSAIKNLKSMVHGPRTVGYSDYTPGIKASSASVLVGATMVEKHLVLDKKMPCVDNKISADPTMMKEMIIRINEYEKMLGDL